MRVDAVVIGAGAAGLFCAGQLGQRGRSTLLLDHAEVLGEKIRISGGGRCNFTNIHSSPEHFLSLNPHFVRSALARYSPQDFVTLVKRSGIRFHEKHRGQLFCDGSSNEIIEMLHRECTIGRVDIRHPVTVHSISSEHGLWSIETSIGSVKSVAVVIATGGLPVPAIGATGFALDFARQLGLAVTPIRPALVPLSFTSDAFDGFSDLAGLSSPVRITAGEKSTDYGHAQFLEDLLITHKGLSGPAVLQASSYWHEGQHIEINWAADLDLDRVWDEKDIGSKTTEGALAMFLPERLARKFTAGLALQGRRWAEISKKDRHRIKNTVTQWRVRPAGTLGWKKAEVMLGGVDTRELDSRTMMAKKFPGLYFIGECVDVTGHLGGHNFQWAWASGYACAEAVVSG